MKTSAIATRLRATTALVLLLAAGHAGAQQAINRIVAVVNDNVITASELNERVRLIRDQLRSNQQALPPGPVLERQVLDRMIIEEIQLQLATQNGLAVDDIELNEALRTIARRNNVNLLQFREILARDGYDFSEYREQIRRDITLSKLRERQVASRISVTDQEIDHFLERQTVLGNANVEYRLAQILVALPEGASPERIGEARDKVQRIVERLQRGADFAQLAVAESDGQQALQGGDLGWREAGQVPRLFSDTVGRLGVGEVSEPIRSPSGFHLLKLIDKRGEKSQVIMQTKVRHILIQTNAIVSDAEARQRLDTLRIRLINGEPFEALARSNSDDSRSAGEGGDLGWITPGELTPPFEEAMAKLAPGDISQPVQSQFGWHLIQVLERREQDVTDALKRSQARQALFRRKAEEETQLWLRRLRDEAYVEYRTDS